MFPVSIPEEVLNAFVMPSSKVIDLLEKITVDSVPGSGVRVCGNPNSEDISGQPLVSVDSFSELQAENALLRKIL